MNIALGRVMYLGSESVEECLVAPVLQGRDRRTEVREFEGHVHHTLRPGFPLVIIDLELRARAKGSSQV